MLASARTALLNPMVNVAQDIAVKAYQQNQGTPNDGGSQGGAAGNDGTVDADFSDVQ